jgi:hypothetical protein
MERVVDYLTMEELAISSSLEKAKLDRCEENGKLRIIAVTSDGDTVVTPCKDEREVRKSFIIVANYLKWSKSIYTGEKAKGEELWAK